MKLSSMDCDWKAIEGFRSDDEYERFRAQIIQQVRLGLAKEERVRKRYSGIDWDEHWSTLPNRTYPPFQEWHRAADNYIVAPGDD